MAGHSPSDDPNYDPCAAVGPEQRWALVWFVSAIIIGIVATSQFMKIDTWMYNNDAEVLDMKAYKENRQAQASVASGWKDERQGAGYSTVLKELPK